MPDEQPQVLLPLQVYWLALPPPQSLEPLQQPAAFSAVYEHELTLAGHTAAFWHAPAGAQPVMSGPGQQPAELLPVCTQVPVAATQLSSVHELPSEHSAELGPSTVQQFADACTGMHRFPAEHLAFMQVPGGVGQSLSALDAETA